MSPLFVAPTGKVLRRAMISLGQVRQSLQHNPVHLKAEQRSSEASIIEKKRLITKLEQSQAKAIDEWTHAFEKKQDENHVLQERVQEAGKNVIETESSMLNTLQSEHVHAQVMHLEGRFTTRMKSSTSKLQQTRGKEQELGRYKLDIDQQARRRRLPSKSAHALLAETVTASTFVLSLDFTAVRCPLALWTSAEPLDGSAGLPGHPRAVSRKIDFSDPKVEKMSIAQNHNVLYDRVFSICGVVLL